MVAGLVISTLKGTPLYALAKNANVYGGKTLSKAEMVFFQQQAREMGFDPIKYGLEITPEDMEGENFKETKKNTNGVQNYIQKSYENQFGKKNNAVKTAQDAETKAYAIIKVAKEAFARNHRGVEFCPEQLGSKPNFMAPEYKDNLTKYVSDLNAWAQDVAHGYNDADSLSNEQLARLIMANDNQNTVDAAIHREVIAESLGDEIGGVEDAVKQEGASTRRIVKQEGANTRQTVREESKETRINDDINSSITREQVRAS